MTSAGYVKPPWAARVIGARMARLFKPAVVSVLAVQTFARAFKRRWGSRA